MGPTWDMEVVEKAYNLTFVAKAMYTEIMKQLAPADILALCYTFGRDFFARGPPYMFGQQLIKMTLNQTYTLLCMVTGELKWRLAPARGVQAYFTKDTEANENRKQPANLFELHFRALLEWIMEAGSRLFANVH